jgi:hypothetical protein
MSAAVDRSPPHADSTPKCHDGTGLPRRVPWTGRPSNLVDFSPSGSEIREATSVSYGSPAAWPSRYPSSPYP